MSSSFRNLVILMLLSPTHENIQVMLILDENEMNCLQVDPKLLKFSSLVAGRSSN